MSQIFEHTDHEGDELDVCTPEEPREYNGLAFNATSASGRTFQGAYLPRSEVLSLIQALTEWAYPTHTPEGPNRSLIEELIVRAVKDQVSAVLPLHLSPVSRRVCAAQGGCEDSSHDPEPGDGALRCGGCGVALPLGRDASMGHPCVDDPEPGDVGHPRPPAESVSEECARCNHRWGNHNPQGCQLSTCTCTKSRVAEDGPCADCGHGKDRHRPVCAVVMRDDHGVICRCNAYKAPAAEITPPEACRCGHGEDRHRPHCSVYLRALGRICRCDGFGPDLPVRKKTVIVPVCGLCKQPWSDGHGQPGDPCPGVEEARQHPNDWTDALWRVQQLCGACAAGNHPHVFHPCAQTGCACTESAPGPTSAPASEARYCDRCGHSWESHPPEPGKCTSIVGKSACGCFARRPE